MYKKRPNLLEVAKEAGVSPATVSRVFNNNLSVNEQMKKRVLQVAERLGYKRNIYAKALIEGKTDFVGLILTRFDIRHYTRIVSGIESVIDDAGYRFFVTNTRYSKEKEEEKITLFSDLNFAGIIAVSVGLSDEQILGLVESIPPLIIFDRKVIGYEENCIYFDYHGYQKEITELLIQNGHTDIVHVCGPTRLQVYREKYNGYTCAMKENNLEGHIQYIICDRATNEAGYKAIKEALDERKFTAIVCQNDQLAFGSISAITERGLTVPEDISITGFGDVPEAQFSIPALTTVNFNYEAIGNYAGRKLLSLLRKEAFSELVPAFKIVQRKSVKRI